MPRGRGCPGSSHSWQELGLQGRREVRWVPEAPCLLRFRVGLVGNFASICWRAGPRWQTVLMMERSGAVSALFEEPEKLRVRPHDNGRIILKRFLVSFHGSDEIKELGILPVGLGINLKGFGISGSAKLF